MADIPEPTVIPTSVDIPVQSALDMYKTAAAIAPGGTGNQTLTERAYSETEIGVLGTSGNDHIHPNDAAAASTAGHTLVAGGGNDVVIGGAGADFIHGSAFQSPPAGIVPTLVQPTPPEGDAGVDAVPAAATADSPATPGNFNVIEGGQGNDHLFAGPGTDHFYFGKGSGQDVIHNFNGAYDDFYIVSDVNGSGINETKRPTITDVGAGDGHLAGVKIDLTGGNSVIVEGVLASDLNSPASLSLFDFV